MDLPSLSGRGAIMAEFETTTSRNKLERPGPQGLVRRVMGHLAHGGTLPDEFWQSRHRFLLELTWLHATLIARYPRFFHTLDCRRQCRRLAL